MVSPKPKFGATRRDFLYFPISEEEIENVLSQFAIIFEEKGEVFKVNQKVKRDISRLIKFYKWKKGLDEDLPTAAELKVELNKLHAEIEKVISRFELDTESSLRQNAYEMISRKMILDDGWKEQGYDPVFIMCNYGRIVSNYTEEIISELQPSPRGRPKAIEKQIIAEELARLFDKELNHEPKKSREGLYCKCYDILMTHLGAALEDYFDIISSAIDEYPNKEPHFIIGIEKMPGL